MNGLFCALLALLLPPPRAAFSATSRPAVMTPAEQTQFLGRMNAQLGQLQGRIDSAPLDAVQLQAYLAPLLSDASLPPAAARADVVLFTALADPERKISATAKTLRRGPSEEWAQTADALSDLWGEFYSAKTRKLAAWSAAAGELRRSLSPDGRTSRQLALETRQILDSLFDGAKAGGAASAPVPSGPAAPAPYAPGEVRLLLRADAGTDALDRMRRDIAAHYPDRKFKIEPDRIKLLKGWLPGAEPFFAHSLLARFPEILLEAGSIGIEFTGGPGWAREKAEKGDNTRSAPFLYAPGQTLPELDLSQFEVVRGGAIKRVNDSVIQLNIHLLSEGARIRLNDGVFSVKYSKGDGRYRAYEWILGSTSAEPHLIYTMPAYAPPERPLTEFERRGLAACIDAYLEYMRSNDYPINENSKKLYGLLRQALPF